MLGKTRLLEDIKGDFSDWIKYSVGIVIFGLMSLLGTLASINYNGVLLNVRDGGPIYGGPLVRPGDRYWCCHYRGAAYRFSLGGATVVPCCLATLIAGVVSGCVWYFYREKITTLIATFIAIGLCLVHVVLICLLTPNGLGWEMIFETPTGLGILILVPLSVAILSWFYQWAKDTAAP